MGQAEFHFPATFGGTKPKKSSKFTAAFLITLIGLVAVAGAIVALDTFVTPGLLHHLLYFVR
jgi:hypothetical protein